MRIRFKITKGEGVRFLSHLDYMKAFFRAARRASLPVAFSEGFNPHPRIFFASALPLGVSSESEYVDVELSSDLEPAGTADILSANLPPDIRVLGAVVVEKKAPSLMAQLNRAVYDVVVRGYNPEQIEQAIPVLMGQSQVVITKQSKKGPKEVDIRPGLYRLQVCGNAGDARKSGYGDAPCTEIIMELAAGNEFNIRPQDVLKAIEEVVGESYETAKIHRRTHFVEQNGQIMDPMEMTGL